MHMHILPYVVSYKRKSILSLAIYSLPLQEGLREGEELFIYLPILHRKETESPHESAFETCNRRVL